MTVYVDYQDLFPDSEETRHVHVLAGNSHLPSDNYVLNEHYCGDISCDCCRVRLEVIAASSRKLAAVVYYAWEEGEEADLDGQNPYLEPMAAQGPHAEAVRGLVEQVINDDSVYRERLKRHYGEVKQFLADHPELAVHEDAARARQAIASWSRMLGEGLGPPTRSPRERNQAKRRRKRKEQRRSRKRNR